MFDTMTVTVSKVDVDGPVFHSVTLGTEHNTTTVIESICARAEAAGWGLVSVVVKYDSYWEEEMISGKAPEFLVLLDFFDLLTENKYSADSIVAYVKEFGFDYVDEWEDAIKFQSDNKEGLAIEWMETYGPKLYEEYNSSRYTTEYVEAGYSPYLSIDWDDTADNIAASEACTITYLNGSYYMFS